MEENSKQLKDIQDAIDKLSASAKNYEAILESLHKRSSDLYRNGQAASAYYKDVTALIEKYRVKIDTTATSIDVLNVKLASQNRVETWGKAFDGAKDKVDKFSSAAEGMGKVLGSSAGGFKPLAENLKNAVSATEPFKNGIAKANQAYTLFREGMASGKGVMESVKGVMPGLTGGMKTFKVALAETGIGLIVIAVAALIEKLQTFKPLMDQINAVVAAAGAVMSTLGNFLLHPTEGFKNLGSSMASAAKDAYQLSLAQDKLKTSLSAQEVANESIQDEIDLLKEKTENTKLSLQARGKALTEAQEIEKKNYNINKDLADKARAYAIEDARIKGGLNATELAKLKERGTQYAAELLQEGKITQEHLDAIKKADQDLIKLRKEQRASSKEFLESTEKLEQEAADKKKGREEAAAKHAAEQAEKTRQARERKKQRIKEMNDFINQAAKEMIDSKMRQANDLLSGYTLEIKNTQDHYNDLLKKYQKYIEEYFRLSKNDPRYAKAHLKELQAAQNTEAQLTGEMNDKLNAITARFQQNDLARLTQYQSDLNKAGKKGRQLALDELKEDYEKQKKEVEAIREENFAFSKYANIKLSAFDKSNLTEAEQKQKANLEAIKAKADKAVADAKNILDRLESKNVNDTTALNKTFDKTKKDEAFEKEKDGLEGNIAKDQMDGNWQKEFADKQALLKLEYDQAISAEGLKEGELYKIKKKYKDDTAELNKAKQDAEVANQKKYLQSISSVATAVTGIFGKNTIAARVAFKAQQAAAAGQVIIETKKSIMNIWSANSPIPFVGVPKAIAETAIVAAVGASNLAAIIKQKPGFARGGQYTSDGRGALLPGYSRTDNTNAYLRSGEAVVVSEAMRNPWARNLVSAINVAHGGRDFSIPNPGRGYAIGGIFTDGGNANRYYSQPVNDQKEMANTLAYQMLNNFPPIYVDVKDVNNQQNILAQTVDRVNL